MARTKWRATKERSALCGVTSSLVVVEIPSEHVTMWLDEDMSHVMYANVDYDGIRTMMYADEAEYRYSHVLSDARGSVARDKWDGVA